jgi:hypothetical protein
VAGGRHSRHPCRGTDVWRRTEAVAPGSFARNCVQSVGYPATTAGAVRAIGTVRIGSDLRVVRPRDYG